MTREFNRQRRDNARPSFRNQSPNRHRDEPYARPSRPRLNRATVDRAWESGAQQQHADYRPRSTNGKNGSQGQQSRNPRNNSNGQQSEYSSYNGRNGNRTYGKQQEQYRGNRSTNYRDDRRENPRNFGRNSDGPYGSYSSNSSRSFGPNRRNFDDRRDSFNGPNRGSRNSRPDVQQRDTSRRDFRRDDRPPRNDQGNRFQRDTRNPRWQTRPEARREYSGNTAREAPHTDGHGSQDDEWFEGDYERFDRRDSRPERSSARPPRKGSGTQNGRKGSGRYDDSGTSPVERHVTRLPDGRVLKGSRPEQRKKAQFWTGIAEDTEDLLHSIEPTDAQEAASAEEKPTEVLDSGKTAQPVTEQPSAGEITSEAPSSAEKRRKGRTRAVSAATRSKKAGRPTSTGPKPSQRGFKWPTQQ